MNNKFKSILTLIRKKDSFIPIIFFVIFFFIGVNIYKDYGVSWDEQYSRRTGLVSLKYIGDKFSIDKIKNLTILNDPDNQISKIQDYNCAGYGVSFDLPCILLEVILKIDNIKDAYLLKHLCDFLLFFASLIFLYKLLLIRFKDYKYGLLGCLILILSPRIFACAFYDPKDVVFLSFVIITSYFLIRTYKNDSLKNIIIFSFFSGIIIPLRITGMIIPSMYFLFMLIKILYVNNKINFTKSIIKLFTYLILTICFVYISFPYLWEDPINNFLTAYQFMSHIYNTNSIEILYNGKMTGIFYLPRTYLLNFFIITTPFIYLFSFLVSIYFYSKKLLKFNINDEEINIDFLFLFLFLAPILIVITLKTPLFDGWRHMYFVYAFFVYIVVLGIKSLVEYLNDKKNIKIFLSILFFLSLFQIGFTMINEHPYQNVYFNFLAGKELNNKYEIDYHGLSYRKAFEKVLQDDKRKDIKIWINGNPNNLYLIDESERKRLTWILFDSSEFNINDFKQNNLISEFLTRIYEDFDLKNYHFYSKDNTLERLNEIINIPNLYDKCKNDFFKINYNREIEILSQITLSYRNNKLETIHAYFQMANIIRLNRLILEKFYDKIPKLPKSKHPDYFFSEFKWHKGLYNIKNEFYSISVDNNKIMVVYKNNY